jgi:hypothetical protein
VDVTMTGFDPNTRYSITLHSTSNSNVATERTTTNASGSAQYNQLDYDVPGETVWVTVSTSGRTISSNTIYWE